MAPFGRLSDCCLQCAPSGRCPIDQEVLPADRLEQSQTCAAQSSAPLRGAGQSDCAISCGRDRVNSLRIYRRPRVRSISILGSRSGRAESTRSHGSRSFDRRPGPAAAARTATPSHEPHTDHARSRENVPHRLRTPRAAGGTAGVPGHAEITRMDGRTDARSDSQGRAISLRITRGVSALRAGPGSCWPRSA